MADFMNVVINREVILRSLSAAKNEKPRPAACWIRAEMAVYGYHARQTQHLAVTLEASKRCSRAHHPMVRHVDDDRPSVMHAVSIDTSRQTDDG
jgi:hypothetical protein